MYSAVVVSKWQTTHLVISDICSFALHSSGNQLIDNNRFNFIQMISHFFFFLSLYLSIVCHHQNLFMSLLECVSVLLLLLLFFVLFSKSNKNCVQIQMMIMMMMMTKNGKRVKLAWECVNQIIISMMESNQTNKSNESVSLNLFRSPINIHIIDNGYFEERKKKMDDVSHIYVLRLNTVCVMAREWEIVRWQKEKNEQSMDQKA